MSKVTSEQAFGPVTSALYDKLEKEKSLGGDIVGIINSTADKWDEYILTDSGPAPVGMITREELTDHILSLMKQRIEQVGNPYSQNRVLGEADMYDAFEEARQAISRVIV